MIHIVTLNTYNSFLLYTKCYLVVPTAVELATTALCYRKRNYDCVDQTFA